MIKSVTLRRFKRFTDVTFELPGHVVLAGPNNTGKTTVLQAIAAWDLALRVWQQRNDFQRHGIAYSKVPIARPDFAAVPLRNFELLWNERQYKRQDPLEIAIQWDEQWTITMELIADTTEQIFVRPKGKLDREILRDLRFQTVYVPPMTGLNTHEPVFTFIKQNELLGQGKPGEVIRNLLVEAHQSDKWEELTNCIKRLFNYELMPPNTSGANIIAEYTTSISGPRFDIASAGSGFQQVLMLLAFLYARPASVLLLDEPDAHLHVLLQDAIYSELRSVATRQNSQLIVSTHSEVIINSVEPEELCRLFNKPKILRTTDERAKLARSMGIITNTDIMLAENAFGVLFVEGHTDIDILREWARILDHPAYEVLSTRLFWKPTISDTRLGKAGIKTKDYYDAIAMIRDDLPGLEILDRDNQPQLPARYITGSGLQYIRWNRYEIESYLVHPTVMSRFVEQQLGGLETAQLAVDAMLGYFAKQMPSVIEDPLGDHIILNGTKASTQIIPKLLNAAEIYGIEKRDFYAIAAVMLPEEIHPEVCEKLDAIQRAFNL
jgi:hypothetical protein